MSKPKIAFVVQRCGIEVAGGAEAYALQIAKLMKNLWNIEILTTCALDYMSWDNHYPEGIEIIDGIPINRFKVDKTRDIESFNRLTNELFLDTSAATIDRSEEWMDAQGPLSKGLLDHLKEDKEKYDKVIFFTYLYATTYYGLPFVEEKSYLAPFAHDEAPIYLPIWNEWFKRPSKFIFSTIEEKEFLQRRFSDIKFDGDIVGIGVDLPSQISNIDFRQKYNIYAPYILYVGRIDQSKGCDHLFDYFLKLKEEYDFQLKLLLAGKSIIDMPEHKDIIHIGFIDEQTKFDAIDGCEFLVNSSPYESLSMVLLEAWSLDKSVLVNAKADVMVGQCKRSGGGLSYDNYDEFKENIFYLLENSYKLTGMREFVETNYSWSVIKEKFSQLL